MKKIDNDVLEVLVNLTCETLTTFSAYDVTSLLRKRLPNVNIKHDDVREMVYNYAQITNTPNYDNGQYRVFSKSLPATKCCQATTQSNTIDVIKQKAKDLANKLSVKTQQFGIPVKAATQPSQAVSVNLNGFISEEKTYLQSEFRINLTDKIRLAFPSATQIYIQKNNKTIVISDKKLPNSTVRTIGGEVRLRTGFTSPKARVVTYSNKIEITQL